MDYYSWGVKASVYHHYIEDHKVEVPDDVNYPDCDKEIFELDSIWFRLDSLVSGFDDRDSDMI